MSVMNTICAHKSQLGPDQDRRKRLGWQDLHALSGRWKGGSKQ